jgi:Na+/melibiose symporter-like transporter
MPLRKRVVASYSSVAFAAELLGTFWGLYALHFMTDDAGLDPVYAGVLTIIYRIWDACNDLLFGHWSDITVSERWGRRRGWMLAGTFPFVLTFIVFWYVPFSSQTQLSHNAHQAILFAWYLFLLVVCDAGFTAVNVGYLALLGDMTVDPIEKFKIGLWRSIVLGLGSIVSVVLSGLVSYEPIEAKLFGGVHLRGWVYLAMFFSLIYVIAVLLCVYYTADIAHTPPPANRKFSRFFQLAKQVLSIREVRLSLIIFVAAVTSVQFTVSCLAYFFLDVLKTTEFQMAMVVLVAIGTATITAIIIKRFFIKSEKTAILRNGLIIWMSFYGFLSLIFEPAWYMYPAACLMGIGLGLSMTIPIAMMSDTADLVEYETGERPDGIIFGMQQFFNKLTLGIFIMMFQFGLELTGFERGKEVTPQAEYAIRVGLLLPIIILMCAYWANSNTTLTNNKLAIIAASNSHTRTSNNKL